MSSKTLLKNLQTISYIAIHCVGFLVYFLGFVTVGIVWWLLGHTIFIFLRNAFGSYFTAGDETCLRTVLRTIRRVLRFLWQPIWHFLERFFIPAQEALAISPIDFRLEAMMRPNRITFVLGLVIVCLLSAVYLYVGVLKIFPQLAPSDGSLPPSSLP